MSNRDEALRYAGLGWRIAPVAPRRKVPAVKKWQEVATDDREQIEQWWARRDYGLCLATGSASGVWALDVDVLEGGAETLRALTAQHGPLPKDGPKAMTGTGGFHLYFVHPLELEVATTKQLTGTGLDVRGEGGQVLLPPTGHAWDQCKVCADPDRECPGLDYTWARDPFHHAIPEAPAWLLDLVAKKESKPGPGPEALPVLAPVIDPGEFGSAAESITAAYSWHGLLLGDGWRETGRSGNDTLWTRPGKDGDGVSAILHEPDGPFVNYSTNAPDLCQDWARNRTGDGWSYSIFGYLAATRHRGDRSELARAHRQQMTDDAMSSWSATSTYTAPVAPASHLPPSDSKDGDGGADVDLSWAHLIDWGAFWDQDHAQQEWVCWPLVPAGRAVALFAPAKAGKSTVVLAAVAAAATGRSVFGGWDAERPRSVLYLDYEMTEADIWERLHELGYGPEVDLSHLHYALLPSMFPLDTEKGAAQVRYLAKMVDAELVVIDTYSRAVEGDENDADTSRDFYRHTGMALKADGRAVLRTDHAGKDSEKGQRGSSAKNDDVDVVWSLARTDQGVRLERTHTRVQWVPPHVEVDHVEHDDGTVAYRLADRRQWPEGTKELAILLEQLEVPIKASARQAAKVLREAGEGARNERIRAAQQYREAYAVEAWASEPTTEREHHATEEEAQDRGLL